MPGFSDTARITSPSPIGKATSGIMRIAPKRSISGPQINLVATDTNA